MQIYVRLRIQSVLLLVVVFFLYKVRVLCRIFMRVPDDGFMEKPKYVVFLDNKRCRKMV